MESLDSWNARRRDVLTPRNEPCKNGLGCPKCSEELLDSSPNYILTSNPPKLSVHCEACGYRGYRRM